MSKKNRNNFNSSNTSSLPSAVASHDNEYKIIRNDLTRVVILNILFLGLVLAVYFTDKQTPYLEQIYNRIF